MFACRRRRSSAISFSSSPRKATGIFREPVSFACCCWAASSSSARAIKGVQLSPVLEDAFSQGRLFWETSARVPRLENVPVEHNILPVLATTGSAAVEYYRAALASIRETLPS